MTTRPTANDERRDTAAVRPRAHPAAKGLPVLLVLIVLAAIAAVRRPEATRADAPVRSDTAVSTEPATEVLPLGELVGRHYRVSLVLIDGETHYTVRTLPGILLAENLSGEDLYRSFPELDIANLRAAEPSMPSLMLATEPNPGH
ncbi:MAG: hypothetical protein AAGG07_01150 [Planctomycetota bacterium]